MARTLARLGKALEWRGHEARIFTVDDPRAEAFSQVIRWPGIPFWAYPELRIALPSNRSVRAPLRVWPPDLIHVATPFGIGWAGVKAARFFDIPVVSSYHTSFSAYARSYGLGALAATGWRYLRWFHNRTRRTYVPTRAIGDELEAHGFTNVRLWPRGVDADMFSVQHRSAELRRSWAAGDDTVVIAYIGRLAKEKSVQIAVDAVRRLAARMGERRREFVFVVIGDGPDEIAARAKAPKGTLFLGRLTGQKLSTAYASADILLFPSTTDTFGNVLLEGMASRLAVVAADMPQAREVCPVSTAEFFPPNDAAALSERIRALIENRGRRERIRDAALAHAHTCGWDAIFDTLIADYETVLAEARRPVARPLLRDPQKAQS